MSDNAIRAIYEDHEGMLWSGTQDHGLDKLDPTISAPSKISAGNTMNELHLQGGAILLD